MRLGLGIGIVAKMAWDPASDSDLVALDAGHLFEPSVTRIGFCRDVFMRGYMYEFIEMWAPHLGADLVNEAIRCRSVSDLEGLFATVKIPELQV